MQACHHMAITCYEQRNWKPASAGHKIRANIDLHTHVHMARYDIYTYRLYAEEEV